MNGKETRAKRAAIRQEIKERMQRELDECKKEIKERIRREDIPIEEKREKYRREVHEQKLRLIELARAEFRARKRMLGRVPEGDVHEEPLETPLPGAPSTHEEDQTPQG
ncbi:MAG: hypothetical protein JSV16_08765, partial [Candidatus Hydrogenedentota bacterium]